MWAFIGRKLRKKVAMPDRPGWDWLRDPVIANKRHPQWQGVRPGPVKALADIGQYATIAIHLLLRAAARPSFPEPFRRA